jgi:hypothetical protein
MTPKQCTSSLSAALDLFFSTNDEQLVLQIITVEKTKGHRRFSCHQYSSRFLSVTEPNSASSTTYCSEKIALQVIFL